MCFACSPVAFPPIWLMMMSTGLPGISRGRYQLATIATSSTPRYHATLPSTYRRNVCTGPSSLLSSAPGHRRPEGRGAGAGARRGGRRSRVRGVREPRPLGVVVLEELQGPVLQRDRRDVLAPEVVQLGEQRRLVGGPGGRHLVEQRRHARIREPVVVPEGG